MAAKAPVTRMAGPYGHPWHPALVTVPIGAWIASLVLDVGSHVVSDPTGLARGSQWLIAIGVIGALVAASLGLLDLFAIPTGTRAFRIGLIHLSTNVSVVVLFIVDYLWRSGHGAAAVPIGRIVLSAIGVAALGLGGYLGGELAYRFGVRVVDEATQAEGFSRKPR